MLSITATNFGVNPSDIQIKEYHEQNLLVLEGDISVDTTAAEYAGIRPMKLTVADLPFAKSRVSNALVTAASEGVNYCTLAKVWIADKNTICIGKIIPYKSLGSYTIHLNTILIPTKITSPVALNAMKTYVPQFNKGTGDGVEVYNAANKPNMNALGYEYCKKLGLPMTAGSDIHYYNDNPMGAMLFERKIESVKDLAKALVDGSGIPVSLNPDGTIIPVSEMPEQTVSTELPTLPVIYPEGQ